MMDTSSSDSFVAVAEMVEMVLMPVDALGLG
jgi:hypothetical protein